MMDYTKAEMLQYLKEKIDTINILPIELVDSNEFLMIEQLLLSG